MKDRRDVKRKIWGMFKKDMGNVKIKIRGGELDKR